MKAFSRRLLWNYDDFNHTKKEFLHLQLAWFELCQCSSLVIPGFKILDASFQTWWSFERQLKLHDNSNLSQHKRKRDQIKRTLKLINEFFEFFCLESNSPIFSSGVVFLIVAAHFFRMISSPLFFNFSIITGGKISILKPLPFYILVETRVKFEPLVRE